MNVHSLSNPQGIPLKWKRTLRVLPNTRCKSRAKDALLRRKLRHSAQRDAPILFDASRHGVQDFVSHTGCTVCETTGTGCAAG